MNLLMALNLFVNYFIILLLLMGITQSTESRPIQQYRRSYEVTKTHTNAKPSGEPITCPELPSVVLNDILGAAYNQRYMSVDQPREEQNGNIAGKRGTESFPPFYVDDTFALDLSDQPAWEVHPLITEAGEGSQTSTAQNTANNAEISHISDDILAESNHTKPNRVPRSNQRRRTEVHQANKRPWECEAKIKWLDLGSDYYPRFLRTVECTKHNCWYGHYTCKPRSFTVKILRRRKGECVQTKNKIGVAGLPGNLRELWIWEERAVNFCCDCSA